MTANRNTESSATQTSIRGREFVMERTFDAPCELVFKVWSDPKHVTQWWGPTGWTLPVCKMDFRPGGVWTYCMRGPDGTEGWGRATYREIVESERIVYVDTFADDQGNALEGMPEMVITVEFIDMGGKTKLRSTAEFATVADLEQTVGMGMEEGIKQTWDRLDEYLTNGEITMTNGKVTSTVTMLSEREISMSRVFDAPRELVFKAHTDAKLLAQWWGQRTTTNIVDKLDARTGGAWRFVQRAPDGSEYAFRGEFREITPPERIVQTFEFEGMPGKILVETLTFEDLGGKTRITTTSLFDSQEDRDGMIATGMEEGANESWDRLGELLETQTA